MATRYGKKWMGVLGILTFALLPLAGNASGAEQYPTQTIKVICGYAPGGTLDLQTRLLLPFVQKHLGQTVMMENLTGADAILATNRVFTSPPDGYTLLTANIPVLIMQEKYLPEIAHYQTKSLTHIAAFIREDFVLLSHPEVWKNFDDFLKAAQGKRLKVGIPGRGTPGHLYAAMVEDIAKVKFNIIPFEGGGPLRTAVVGKHVDAVSTILSGGLPLVRSGSLNALVVLSDRRHPALPQTPTIVEATGIKSFEPIFYITGIFAPPKTAASRVKILEDAIAKALKEPEFLEKAKRMNAEVYPLNSREFLANTERQYPQVEKYIKIFKGK